MQEQQTFLGLLIFYHSFLKDEVILFESLSCLLDKDAMWNWTKLKDKSFNNVKELLLFDSMLVHYDIKRPLLFTCDASLYSVRSILSHLQNDVCEAPLPTL